MKFNKNVREFYCKYKQICNWIFAGVSIFLILFFYFFSIRVQLEDRNNTADQPGVKLEELVTGDVLEQSFVPIHNVKSFSILADNEGRVSDAEFEIILRNDVDQIIMKRTFKTNTIVEASWLNFEIGGKIDAFKTYKLSITCLNGESESSIMFYGFHNENNDATLNQSAIKDTTLCINQQYYKNRILNILPLMIIFMFLLALLYFIRHRAIHVKLFLLIVCLGGMISFLTPAFDNLDEVGHYMKSVMTSYGIALDGNIKGKQLPSQYYDFIINNNGRTVNTDFVNVESGGYKEITKEETAAIAVYPFFGYVPQTTAILIQRALHLSGQFGLYLGRFLNVILYAFLCSYAVKKSPKIKAIMSAVCLAPGLIVVASSLNQDAMTYGVFFLTIAYFLKLFCQERLLTRREKIIFISLFTLLSVLKYNFLPLILLYTILPINRFKNRKEKWKTFILSLICCVIIVGCWYLFVSSNFEEFRVFGVSTSQQVKFLLSHPIQGMFNLVNSVFVNLYEQFMQCFSLGYHTYSVSNTITLIYLIFLVYICFKYNDLDSIFSLNNKVMMALIVFGTLLLTNTILYLTWTNVGGLRAMGVQGRYMLPLIVFMPVFISLKKKSVQSYTPLLITSFIFLTFVVMTIAVQYY